MKQRIINYIRAGYSGLALVSHEEQRVEATIKQLAGELGYTLHAWSATAGLLNTDTGALADASDPLEVIAMVEILPEKSLVLLRDFHSYLGNDPNPILVRKLKDILQLARTQNKTLLFLGCQAELPVELQREITVLEFTLPDRNELSLILEGIVDSAPEIVTDDILSQALDAARGMTTIEAENAFALSVIETGSVSPQIISREKAAGLKQNGLLEIIDTPARLDDVGGLDQLKEWLRSRRNAFSREAQAYGLPAPKGMLVFGISGTGKSLTAKATASSFGIPLLKLDAGRIFAGLVGESERNLRSVIQTAEAIAPCCVWVDELDKAFSGASGSGDGGTSARVLGALLSWMQEKTALVFVVATANDVTGVPPELLRKGRFDEVWFVDLPSQKEREGIWQIQIARYHRNPDEFDVVQLAKATDGLTGSEIEQLFVEAMHQAFERGQEPTDLTVAQCLEEFVPLSKLMAEQVEGLRQWARGRARPATTPVAEKKGRKLLGKETD